jgi:hypothetical protein
MPDVHIGPESILDLTEAYIDDNMPKTWYDAARTYTKSIFATYFLQKSRIKRRTPSEKYTFNLKVGKSRGTRPTGFFDTLAPPRTDLAKKGEVGWTWQDSSFVIDIREPCWNGQGKELEQFDYLEMQEQDLMDGFFEQNDEWLLSLAAGPNDGTDGHPVPFGLPYILTPSTTAAFGFNGELPSGYTSKFGIDSSNDRYKGYRNGTFTMSAISDMDGLIKMETANKKCNFKSYKKVSPETEPGEAETDYLLISHEDWYFDYSKYLKTHNDNTEKDGGKYSSGRKAMDSHVFQGVEWIYAEQFSDEDSTAYDATKPMYGLNLTTFEINTYGDWWMKRKKPVFQSDAPNVAVIVMDTGFSISAPSIRSSWRARVAA